MKNKLKINKSNEIQSENGSLVDGSLKPVVVRENEKKIHCFSNGERKKEFMKKWKTEIFNNEKFKMSSYQMWIR